MTWHYQIRVPLVGGTETFIAATATTPEAAAAVVRILLENRREDVSQLLVQVVPAGPPDNPF